MQTNSSQWLRRMREKHRRLFWKRGLEDRFLVLQESGKIAHQFMKDGEGLVQGLRAGERTEQGLRAGERLEQGLRAGERVEQGLRAEERLEQGLRAGERVEQGLRAEERLEQGLRAGERVEQGLQAGERTEQGRRAGNQSNVICLEQRRSAASGSPHPPTIAELEADVWELRKQFILHIANRRNGKVRLQEVAAECNVNIRIAAEWLIRLSMEGMLSLVAGQRYSMTYLVKETGGAQK
ncbi:hypothetical protein [Paenibacillus oryzisoli]|uniref:Uncharacterized protein n=1 Tax=Paenibacillus oryzisoli TaxID=1850517 RepID=A0A198AHI1_9BACL|nr:hypothetical protein [Paenibacillus oryzisoli]OAS20501.1 hypothetical protein A8708_18205 [Paenibacillus oryzisoli]